MAIKLVGSFGIAISLIGIWFLLRKRNKSWCLGLIAGGTCLSLGAWRVLGMRDAGVISGAGLAFAGGTYLGHFVIEALRGGVAEAAGGKKYKRKKNPLMYRVVVGAQSFFSAGCFWIGVARLVRL